MPEPQPHTPLVAVGELPYQGRDIELAELSGQGYVNLRGDAAQTSFTQAVQTVCAVELPLAANTASGVQPPCALWLGPDEWLLRLRSEADAADAVAGLDGALGGQFYAANDLSSAYTALRLTGSRAREVLSKGCTLDLHARVFSIGQCAQTNVAKSVAVLAPIDAAGGVDVIVRRSFADYLARWLLDAGR